MLPPEAGKGSVVGEGLERKRGSQETLQENFGLLSEMLVQLEGHTQVCVSDGSWRPTRQEEFV